MFSVYTKSTITLLFIAPLTTLGQNYFDVMSMTCTEKKGGTVYNAAVDFPVGGNDAVTQSAKAWIGEVLDVDGECGGFNLQWAWSSGCVAGKLGKREDTI